MQNDKNSEFMSDLAFIKNQLPQKNGAEVTDSHTVQQAQVNMQVNGNYDIADKVLAKHAVAQNKKKIPVMVHLSQDVHEKIMQMVKKTKSSKSSIIDDVVRTALFG